MKSRARLMIIPVIAAFAVITATPALAAMAYMRADGVQGPVVRDGQPGWFKADNFKWGSLAKPAPGNRPPRSGSGAFSLTKLHDSASTDLMKFCMQGGHIPKGTIEIRHAAGQKPQKYTVFSLKMTECPEEGALGLERYAFDFGSIKWEFTGQKKDKKKDPWKSGK